MSSPSHPPLDRSRQTIIDQLCEHFAEDRLTVEEFESRLDTAHRAGTNEELDALLRDLPRKANTPARRADVTPAQAGYSLADPGTVKERELVIAIMGGTGRKGRWSPARNNFVVAVMGGAELDFRDAVLPPGVTEVQIYTVWGGVDIVVPPDLHVESHGFAILGGFEHAAEDAIDPGPGAPTLRITGIAMMGAVDINVRRPGESTRDARRRRRLERRELRRLEDGS